MSERVRAILAGLVLLASAAWFFKQSFFKDRFLWDFGVYDASSHAWLSGQNPYDGPTVWAWWSHCGIWPRFDNNIDGLPPVSPPMQLVIMAPIAALPPTVSACVWVLLCVVLLILELIALVRLARLPAWSAAGMLLMASVLLLSPLRISFLTGQSASPAASLIILAVLAARDDRQRTAGLLLAVAAGLKLQLALPFILIYFFVGRPRAALWGLALTCVLGAIALVGLHAGGTDWIGSWTSALDSVNAHGGLNDFDASNIFNYELLNLQLPIGAISSSRELTNAVSIGAAGVMTLVFLGLLIKGRSVKALSSTAVIQTPNHPHPCPLPEYRERGKFALRWDDLLMAATLAPLLLLPVYHRDYDGVILSLTIAWVFREVRRTRPTIPCFVGLLLFLSMVTPQSLIARLKERLLQQHHYAMVHSVWFNALVVPHRVWIIALITLAMLYELGRRDVECDI